MAYTMKQVCEKTEKIVPRSLRYTSFPQKVTFALAVRLQTRLWRRYAAINFLRWHGGIHIYFAVPSHTRHWILIKNPVLFYSLAMRFMESIMIDFIHLVG